jgi:SAM-dependent methyltransferase
MTAISPHCWICGSGALRLVKPSNIPGRLTSDSFSITDSRYGVTGAVYRCESCRFLQCADMPEVLPFYEKLADSAYEAGRMERGLQARKILEAAHRLAPKGRLLDIGAGSGILVEQALAMGYDAEGIEPSEWLQRAAAGRSLPVHQGTFPHPAAGGPYDLVTLIDVIEHVSEPVALLREVARILGPAGKAIIVTPDAGSLAARLFSWKWWHFRIAHIGYFNRGTLLLALERAGLEPVSFARTGWYFTMDYLWVRTHRYLPAFLRSPLPGFLAKRVIPVNLRDSWLVACERKR